MKPATKLLAKFLALASALALCVATLSAPLCAAGPCAGKLPPVSSRGVCHSTTASDDAAQIISATCKNCSAADLPAAVVSFSKENHCFGAARLNSSSASSAVASIVCAAANTSTDCSQRCKAIDANSIPTGVPQVITLRI
jgi:hypothetical protein